MGAGVWAAVVLAVLAAGLVGFVVVRPRPVRVSSDAMAPALQAGQYIVVTGNVGTIARGEVIAFRNPSEPSRSHLSRVVALPGERLTIVGGVVQVNGKALDEPYVSPENRDLPDFGPYRVPPNQYFVMGDNRRNAMDSRLLGAIERDLIWGKRMR